MLGAGAFGEVYEVFDHNLSLRGALKFFEQPPPLGHRWAEAHTLKALDGPFVLHVQNADVSAGQQFIVTDLAENGSVADHIIDAVGMPVEQARTWGRDIIGGVARVHLQNLLHCDMKPENVFLTATGSAIVGDFGLAQPQDDDGLAYAAGSLHTMAPEVAAAFSGGTPLVYTTRSDVYSVGATIYWMLAGRPVLPDATNKADIASMTVADLWDIAPHVPGPIRSAVMRAVAFDAAARFQTMSEFDSAISGVALPTRQWNKVRPHDGHHQCFEGVARTSTIDLCAMHTANAGRLHVTGTYRSGRRIPSLTREIRAVQLPQAVRKVIRDFR